MGSQPPQAHPIISSLRSSSRLLVRELGFMSSNLAGTSYSASAVHAIIEIGLHEQNLNQTQAQSPASSKGKCTGITAATLCTELNLEKSSVSRLLKKLVEAGEVREGFGEDAREKVLMLTEKGRGTLAGIDAFGESQILDAFAQLPPEATPDDILKGIRAYATALRSSRLNAFTSTQSNLSSQASKTTALPPSPAPPPTIIIATGYRPGLLARCLTIHMTTYTPYGLGVSFESMLSTGFGELLSRLDGLNSEAFTALDSSSKQILGTIFMDGINLSRKVNAEANTDGENVKINEKENENENIPSSSPTDDESTNMKSKVHLRGFVVDESVRGGGVGKRMLDAALKWADERRFEEVHLWTFKGLDAARKLYEGRGFVLRDQEMKSMWEGKELLVQHLVRVRSEMMG
ncbi:GCN5-like N-acetyltransferase [Leptodontidium sp. MPI-SDFR-AT-0119]|nr:GCN5-like N-acetyltransferase [Leptodontidium sp. MPI-SDFR-AT-0119]